MLVGKLIFRFEWERSDRRIMIDDVKFSAFKHQKEVVSLQFRGPVLFCKYRMSGLKCVDTAL